MDGVGSTAFMEDWKRKLIAVVGALAIWLFVHQSITSSRIISNIPVRLVNLPQDKTVAELLPNGILNRRVTITLTGTKDVVERIEPSDLEVIIDASNRPDEWNLQINKKDLFSLNPELDLSHHIRSVSSSEFYLIKLSRLITEKIPVTITPKREAPGNYEFMDIWPQALTHTVTGPEEQVRQLKQQGFHLTFDLEKITRGQLDQLQSSDNSSRDDEVKYIVPDRWKSVVVPFDSDIPELINDPKAEDLHITFLRKKLKIIEGSLPVRVFYPVDSLETINPRTYILSDSGQTLKEINGLKLLSFPVLAGEVSHVFLDVVRENIEIVIIAAPPSEREYLDWSVEFINQRGLEDKFVALLMAEERQTVDLKKKEQRLRRRFRNYMQNLQLYKQEGQRLLLQCRIENGSIIVNNVSAVL